MIRFVPWSEVGTISVSPGDNVVEVGAFELAEGADTLWVRMTNTGTPGPWPWSYGILSFKTEEGQPLGSIKAYNSFHGEVFRLGVGLTPSVRSGVLTFEPRGFNLAWIKQGNPWTLKFEAQSGAREMTNYWFRDPVNGALSPVTPGDSIVLGTGDLSADIITTSGDAGIGGDLSATKGVFVGDVAINDTGTGTKIYAEASSGNLFANRFEALAGINSRIFTSTHFQVSGSGDVFIGGTLPSDPNIRLNSNGNATFKGRITASNVTFSGPTVLPSEPGHEAPVLDLLQELVRLEALVGELYARLQLEPGSVSLYKLQHKPSEPS